MVRYAFTKVGMTSAFTAEGEAQGVTVLRLAPSKVLRHETTEDGKPVIVIEYDTGNKKKLVKGWLLEKSSDLNAGASLNTPDFKVGQKLKITGLSKGRGFQDVITKYGFGGGPASHGSRFHRAPGSVGMRTQPGRVMKGKKMPGQDGNAQVTLRNVKVAYWSAEESIVAIVGGVPGARGCVVFI